MTSGRPFSARPHSPASDRPIMKAPLRPRDSISTAPLSSRRLSAKWIEERLE